jgi:Protein of unknown function (DUF3313)
MKTSVKKVMAVVMGIILVSFITSYASAGSQKTVFLGDYYKILKPGGKGEGKLNWIKPGVDFTKYKKVMVDYVIFAIAEDSEYKGIDADEMKKIADDASLALLTAIQGEFPVVSEPGPDVLRIRTAIVDLKPSKPGLSAISTVMPVGLGISIIKKGATDSWTGSGATTAEMMVLDSMTNEVIACGEDKKTAEFAERFSKWGDVEEAFAFWGELFTKRLVNLTKIK